MSRKSVRKERKVVKKRLEAFKVKAREARKVSNLWREALNDWLDSAEHIENLKEIKLLGKREFLMRKKANKATEKMYKSWERLLR